MTRAIVDLELVSALSLGELPYRVGGNKIYRGKTMVIPVVRSTPASVQITKIYGIVRPETL